MSLFSREPKIGIALGGGGVRGLFHLPLLEVIENMGIRPHAIAGTSMGAIIGALYAAGVSPSEFRKELMDYTVSPKATLKEVYEKRKNLVRWLEAFRVDPRSGGVVRPDGFLSFLFERVNPNTFEELNIPLTVVATDYWTGKEVHFSSGELIPAVQASMSIPGVFAPVELNNQILIDGGIVNQVPYDLLVDECDIVIAIDVGGVRIPEDGSLNPKAFDVGLDAFDISQEAVMREKMKRIKPDLYIRPDIRNVGILEFEKYEEILELGDRSAGRFRAELRNLLESRNSFFLSIKEMIPLPK